MRVRALAVSLVVVLAFCGAAVRAQAATPEERPELQRLGRAMEDLLGSLSGYTAWVTSTFTTANTRGLIGQGASDTLGAVDALNDALSGYLGVTASATPHPPFTYAERRARSVDRLDRAQEMIRRAVEVWTAARALNADPVYQDAVNRIILPLGWLEDEIATFNRSLPYADIYPGPGTPNGSHTIVGPHGDFDRAMWSLWRSTHDFTRAMSDVAAAVQRGYPGGSYAGAGRPYMHLSQAIRNSVGVQLVIADVAPSTVDRFFAVLNSLEPLTSQENPATPQALHFLGAFEWPPLLQQFGRDSTWDAMVSDAVGITHDAWKHSDDAVWQIMRFPDCSILNNPAGCGGR